MGEEKNAEGTRENVICTPKKIVYDSPEAVLRAILLTDTHNKGKRGYYSHNAETYHLEILRSKVGNQEIYTNKGKGIYSYKPLGKRLTLRIKEVIYNSLSCTNKAGCGTINTATNKIAERTEEVTAKHEKKDNLHTLALDERCGTHRYKT